MAAPSGMAAIIAGVCVFLSLLAVFPFLLWMPGGEGEKGERVSTSPLRWTVCLGLPPLVARYRVRRKSLDILGGVAAILVGFVLTVGSGCFCVYLLVFFFTSSQLTRWRGREKEKWEEEHKEGVCVHVHACVCSSNAVAFQIDFYSPGKTPKWSFPLHRCMVLRYWPCATTPH